MSSVSLILASSSPRRQELIRILGFPFSVRVSEADESTPPGTGPAEMVEMLALRKADAVKSKLPADESGAVIVGADTIVVLDGGVLGKPADEADAIGMLKRLQGRTHEVYTGVACICLRSGREIVRHRVTRVSMRPLSDERIRRYAASGEPFDKAGSYGIQGLGALIVEGIEGDYFNVVGLPVSLLADMLAELELNVL